MTGATGIVGSWPVKDLLAQYAYVVALACRENPHSSSGERVCDFVYMPDVVPGLLKTGVQPNLNGETVDLGTGEGIKARHVVELLIELSSSAAQPVFGAVPDRVAEYAQIADVEKA